MRGTPGPGGRLLAVGAALLLGFDGSALVVAGAWLGRPLLVMVGVVLAVGAVLVLRSWRGQRRRLEEVASARAEVQAARAELEAFLERRTP